MSEYRTATLGPKASGPYSEGERVTDNPAAKGEPLLGRYVDSARFDAWEAGGYFVTEKEMAPAATEKRHRRAVHQVKVEEYGLDADAYEAVKGAKEEGVG